MGQRSQIFIRLENIGKSWANDLELNNSDKWSDKLPEYIKHQETYKKWKQMYGEKDTIIVAFHHQWLYGRSFVMVASNILFAVKSLNSSYETENILHPEYRNLENPNQSIEWIQNTLSNMFDFELSKYARSGIERFLLLNEKHLDEDFENAYSDNFTLGNNNDGVLLMDFTFKNPKYCFVNIEGDSTVRKLKYLKPVDAHTYLRAYRPEVLTDCSEEELEYARENNKPINHAENIKINKKFIKRIKGFKTLSVEELITMFPLLTGVLLEQNEIIVT
jgi:hypothetical protein